VSIFYEFLVVKKSSAFFWDLFLIRKVAIWYLHMKFCFVRKLLTLSFHAVRFRTWSDMADPIASFSLNYCEFNCSDQNSGIELRSSVGRIFFIFGCLCVQVPKADYELPLGKADILLPGTDITLIGWGTQVSSSLCLKGQMMRMNVRLHWRDHKFNHFYHFVHYYNSKYCFDGWHIHTVQYFYWNLASPGFLYEKLTLGYRNI
jgi:hypothetical protein